ncbi:hypothetical protein [Bacillus solimangrovi]|uniref:Uncharacterized protein n=1 Tax=Bacillus solimangrovi TaxID=1305675 RepID=A0A1E5LD90_9BACI|nr:hypothetical protein [Bacillus solimangrovi]OEH92043.1 hypothetical protein BFG57_17135 [Bacillus solimangrovi]
MREQIPRIVEQVAKVLEQSVKWIVLMILVVSSVSIIVFFQSNYFAEHLIARTVPLAIVIGCSSIAVSILFRK